MILKKKRWEFYGNRCIPNHFWGSVHRDIEDLEADDFRITGSHASLEKSARALKTWAGSFEYHYFTIWHISPSDTRTSLLAHMAKRLPTMRETQVPSLGREDSLQKEVAAHSSILAWKTPWMEECGRQESDTTEQLHFTSPSGGHAEYAVNKCICNN